jgi:alpha-galactosidase
MFVSEDQSEAFVANFRVLAEPNGPIRRLTLKGLDPDKKYIIEHGATGSTAVHTGNTLVEDGGSPFRVAFDGEIFGGDRLMKIGLVVSDLSGDFTSSTFRLKAISC